MTFFLLEEKLEGHNLRSFNYFKNNMQSVEIIKDGHLQKVYFTKPSKVISLMFCPINEGREFLGHTKTCNHAIQKHAIC